MDSDGEAGVVGGVAGGVVGGVETPPFDIAPNLSESRVPGSPHKLAQLALAVPALHMLMVPRKPSAAAAAGLSAWGLGS